MNIKIRQRSKHCEARCRFTLNGKKKEVTIPLKTSRPKVIAQRVQEIQSKSEFIKKNIKFDWWWLKEQGRTTLKINTLKEVSDKWIDSRRNSINVSESHYKRNIVSINRLLDVFGDLFNVEDFKDKHIEDFKSYYEDKHTRVGINFNLKAIKTFLRWCYDNQYINRVPKIVINVPKQDPKYIRESWFNQIMDLDIGEHWKKAFKLYVTSGVRKMEVFNGYIDGTFLIVPAEKTKAKKERQVRLNSSQIRVVKEMQQRLQDHIDNGFKSENFTNRYNKLFVKCLKKIKVYRKGLSLHSLRHTFAITRYLQTGDIYLVKNELGHSSMNATEVYSNMNIHLILEHFPSFRAMWGRNSGAGLDNVKVIPFDKPLQLQRTSNP